ncbi:MAG: glycosyltransferase family 2 protein [Nanoarchaeota archaeon]
MITMDLSIVIPLYNEESCAKRIADGIVRHLEESKIDYELVLVNNGSKDATPKIISELTESNPRIKHVNVEVNLGYGHGVHSGLKASKGDILGWIDGDEQVMSEDIIKLYNVMKAGDYDIAKGRRLVREDGLKRGIASLFYNTLVNIFFLTWIEDVNAKPKLMKREVFESISLESKDWFIDTEFLIKSVKRHYRIGDVGIIFAKRRSGKSNVKLITVSEFLYNLTNFRWKLWNKNQE